VKVAKESWSASAVLDRLCATTFSSPAHAVLPEVRNGTGYGATTRTADALVVSLWPSRGIWFAGVEVKVSRSDWMAELKQPEKSAAIQQWCDYWWIATPAGIVQPGELPSTWGLIEVGAKANRIVTPAPKLDAKPPCASFVAAIFRNRVGSETQLIGNAVAAATMKLREDVAHLAGEDAQRAIKNLEQKLEWTKRDYDSLLARVNAFEQASGIAISRAYDGARLGKEVAIAQRIVARQIQIEGMAKNLADATAELQRIAADLSCKPAGAEAAE
jgi:hypothetical protein